jgi:hypothetical protein
VLGYCSEFHAATEDKLDNLKDTYEKPERVYEFLQEPHGVTTQKTPFFIVTAVKISNLTEYTIISPR